MPIVLTKPAGDIGRHVVRKLINAGKSIRVIVRNPNKLGADVRTCSIIIQGLIDDAAEALFWCVPQSQSVG